MKTFLKIFIILIMIGITNSSCRNARQTAVQADDNFNYFVDQFGDIRILKYKLPAFESLSLQQKEYVWYLSQAALCGRDILWDQNFRYNLKIRKTLEAIISTYDGNKESEEYKAFLEYSKRVFFANGIHHHYSRDKFKPGFTKEYFSVLVNGSEHIDSGSDIRYAYRRTWACNF